MEKKKERNANIKRFMRALNINPIDISYMTTHVKLKEREEIKDAIVLKVVASWSCQISHGLVVSMLFLLFEMKQKGIFYLVSYLFICIGLAQVIFVINHQFFFIKHQFLTFNIILGSI